MTERNTFDAESTSSPIRPIHQFKLYKSTFTKILIGLVGVNKERGIYPITKRHRLINSTPFELVACARARRGSPLPGEQNSFGHAPTLPFLVAISLKYTIAASQVGHRSPKSAGGRVAALVVSMVRHQLPLKVHRELLATSKAFIHEDSNLFVGSQALGNVVEWIG